MDFIEMDGYKDRTKAEEELASRGGSTIVNAMACATNFPKTWSINTLTRHLEIARLVNMYTSLYEDRKACNTPRAKRMIEEEMEKIQHTLLHKYFIVTRDELVPDYELRQRYEEQQKKGSKKK